MSNKEHIAIGLAILAAVFYAIKIPCSKALLADTPPTMMATFLYIGAGIGMGTMMLARKESRLLGYVSYGLSIYVYTYAQRVIGAARTSTYYAVATFHRFRFEHHPPRRADNLVVLRCPDIDGNWRMACGKELKRI